MSVATTSGGPLNCRKIINCSDYKDAIENTRYSLDPDGTLGEPVGNSNSIGGAIGQSTPNINADAVETLDDYVADSLYGNSGGVNNIGTNLRQLNPGECVKPIVANCPTITMDFQTSNSNPASNGLAGFSTSGGELTLGFEIVTDCA